MVGSVKIVERGGGVDPLKPLSAAYRLNTNLMNKGYIMAKEVQGDTGIQALVKKIDIENEIKSGGEWLRAARIWIQHNIRGGDELVWSSNKTVDIRFCDLEEYARTVAAAAIAEDRKKWNK